MCRLSRGLATGNILQLAALMQLFRSVNTLPQSIPTNTLPYIYCTSCIGNFHKNFGEKSVKCYKRIL